MQRDSAPLIELSTLFSDSSYEPMDSADRLLDELLVLRCQSGDDAAFEQVVMRYRAPLLYFIRRITGRSDGDEDVLQQVWMAAYTALPRLKHTDALRVWLYRVARNLAVQAMRRIPPEVHEPNIEDVVDERAEEPDFTEEDAMRIHTGLGRLRQEHREVLALRFLEDMTYEEIAAVVNCDLGTVKSRIHYGKRMLRRELERIP